MIGAGDDRLACFERLTQGVEHVRLKLGKLIEKQHTVVRERNLSGPWPRPTADQRRHARGMMRRAKWPIDRELTADKFTGERMHHRNFENFFRQ